MPDARPEIKAMQEKKDFQVALAYNPTTNKFFIDFIDERGVLISVLITQNVAENLSRTMELKIMQ